jgi:hypothetical protein
MLFLGLIALPMFVVVNHFEAIKMYLFLRRFWLLRERMIPKAQAQGIFTDQDVFDCVS